MTAYGTALNTDPADIKTSADYGDRGDGVSRWYHWHRSADGAHATTGAKADAAVSNPASSGSVIALLKGVLTLLTTLIAGPTPVNSTSTAYVSSRVISATPRKLFGLQGYNSAAVPQFIQVHDAATLPADGAVPKVTIRVLAESNYSLDFGVVGRNFDVGIVVCNSSTGPTKTIGAADVWVDAQVK